MAWDFKFDPITKDTIRDGKGSIELTEAADTMAMHQLELHHAAWWGRRNIGSTLHNLRAFGNRPEISVPAEAKRALGVLEARGRISNIEVAAERSVTPGRVNLMTRSQDTRTGRTIKVRASAGG